VAAPLLPPDTDPIVALATPWGEGALAVIRSSGAGSLDLASRLFRGRRALEEAAGHALLRGRIVDPADGTEIDEVLAAVFRAPRSYTGEDGIEVSCHGGPAVVRRILACFLANGFRQAGPGEFTLRAYLNGRMDLTRAEAVNEIVRARSDRARALALARLSGAVADRIGALKRRVLLLLSALELRLDYPEDEIDDPLPDVAAVEEIRRDVSGLLSTFAAGRLIQEGARVAVAGRPNAGKSTLFNLLLREERSIVSEAPGTTRDYVEGAISLGGIGFRLFDTAGLREASGEVEREGVRRARALVDACDLVLYLVDATAGVTEEDRTALASIPEERVVRLWSKSDIGGTVPPAGHVACSGRTAAGLGAVEAAILSRLPAAALADAGEPVIDSLRQKLLLERCHEALGRAASGLAEAAPLDLVAADTREALDALGEITGEVTTADILETMFGAFCVGK
jgi:tRNA modification GTPase